jgi:hypothetical protein
MTKDAIIAEAVRRAQEDARRNGLKVGQIVAHPNDEFSYGLISVDGDVATVGLTASQSRDGKEVTKRFPLNELFDPNIAGDMIHEIMEEELNRGLPSGCGVMVVKL